MLGPCFVVHWTAWMASSNTTTSGFSYFMGFTSFLSWECPSWDGRHVCLVDRETLTDLVKGELAQPALQRERSHQRQERNFAASPRVLHRSKQVRLVRDAERI